MPLSKWLTTTPGQLRVASVVLVGALFVVLAGTVTATRTRGRAVTTLDAETVPELVAARDLYRSLAEADATQSVIYLQAGLGTPELRRQYETEIADAGSSLGARGRGRGS
jgi:hypothetical protein